MKCDGKRAETRFRLSAKGTSLFKSEGASVQSTTGSRRVRISDSNAGYTHVPRWCEGYWLPTPFASFPFTFPPVRHRVPSHFNWSLSPYLRTFSFFFSFFLLLLRSAAPCVCNYVCGIKMHISLLILTRFLPVGSSDYVITRREINRTQNLY